MYMHSSLGHSFTRKNGMHFCSAATLQHCFVTFTQLNANFNENCQDSILQGLTQNTFNQNYSQIIFASYEAHNSAKFTVLKKSLCFMQLPGEADNLTFNLNLFGWGSLVHFWLPFGSLCRFKASIGPCLGSLEP